MNTISVLRKVDVSVNVFWTEIVVVNGTGSTTTVLVSVIWATLVSPVTDVVRVVVVVLVLAVKVVMVVDVPRSLVTVVVNVVCGNVVKVKTTWACAALLMSKALTKAVNLMVPWQVNCAVFT